MFYVQGFFNLVNKQVYFETVNSFKMANDDLTLSEILNVLPLLKLDVLNEKT